MADARPDQCLSLAVAQGRDEVLEGRILAGAEAGRRGGAELERDRPGAGDRSGRMGPGQMIAVDLEEGKRIAHALGDKKAAILRNHGLLTVGHSVEEAAWFFIAMERSCHAQLMAEAVGTPVLIDPEMAELTRSQVGNHIAGWFSFQPLFAAITRDQPDLFD